LLRRVMSAILTIFLILYNGILVINIF
jgi:hypothetical protein